MTEITKEYQRVTEDQVNTVNEEAADIAERLNLEKRMQTFPNKQVYCTTKDHKSDFFAET